jgi:hypothetical protein
MERKIIVISEFLILRRMHGKDQSNLEEFHHREETVIPQH